MHVFSGVRSGGWKDLKAQAAARSGWAASGNGDTQFKQAVCHDESACRSITCRTLLKQARVGLSPPGDSREPAQAPRP